MTLIGQLFCLRKSSPFQHCHFCRCSIVAILDWIWLSFFVAQPSESIIYQKSSSSSSSSSRANLLFQTSSSSLACSLHDFCYFSKPPHCHRRLPCCIPRIAFDFLLLVLSTVLGWLPLLLLLLFIVAVFAFVFEAPHCRRRRLSCLFTCRTVDSLRMFFFYSSYERPLVDCCFFHKCCCTSLTYCAQNTSSASAALAYKAIISETAEKGLDNIVFSEKDLFQIVFSEKDLFQIVFFEKDLF